MSTATPSKAYSGGPAYPCGERILAQAHATAPREISQINEVIHWGLTKRDAGALAALPVAWDMLVERGVGGSQTADDVAALALDLIDALLARAYPTSL